MTLRIQRGTPRRFEGALYRLRLGIAYTREYYHRVQKAASPECAACEVPETVGQLLSESLIDERERPDLWHTLSLLDNRLFATINVLGAWPTAAMTAKACEAVLRFLRNRELASAL